MTQTLVLASGNQGKLREFRQMFANLPYDIKPQSEFSVSDADETGLSFVENAIIKARHAAEITGLPSLADDSGIEVDALKGAPGIYSARYAGPGKSARDNLYQLLADMEQVPDGQRQCRFQCVLVFMRHAKDPTPIISQAAWEGTLLREPVGTNGFGYDPIFWLADRGCSSAELEPSVKDQLSHRGQALRQLVQILSQKPHLLA